MEDIEYLEEYEDLVLPALNSAAAAAAASTSYQRNNSPQNQKINDENDDSSSSLDQDIFNCLFDDNSDDDFNEYQNSGGKVIEKVEISRQEPTNNFNAIANTANKVTSSAPKTKTCMTKTSGTTVPLNTKAQIDFIAKTKSIATVRPTVQNQQQESVLKKKAKLLREAPSSSITVHRFPIVPPKPITSSSSVDKNPAVSSISTDKLTTLLKKRPTTIIKPERIITKDPVNDPLDLDDISQAESDNYSVSDISGETYNSVSDFEEEDDSNDIYYSGDNDEFYEDQDIEESVSSSSQIIELSNDSSGAPSNLEDLRAPTPSPIISEDSHTERSSSGFKINTAKFVKPYSHPDIIERILRKGEKPKLLELLETYNLLEDSVENDEADNTIIDITTSTENLVENIDTQADATTENNLPPTTITTDTVNLSPTDNNKSLTLNQLNKDQTNNSKETNKNKSKKKSVANMDTTSDYRDLKSPGAMSTDSDLSAVEELLEESYAEAMKRVKDVPFTNQAVGGEIEKSALAEEVVTVVENKENLPKTDVVINYNNDTNIEVQAEKIENTQQNNTEPKEIEIREIAEKVKKEDINEPENFLKDEVKEKEEIKDTKANKLSDSSIPSTVDPAENIKINVDNSTDEKANAISIKCQENKKGLQSTSSISPGAKKKKRFRNLLTPEPTTLETTKSIDDTKDFKGFAEDEIKGNKKVEHANLNTILKTESKEKMSEMDFTLEKDQPVGSFKSPSSHQSRKDKSRDSKGKSSRDNSKESKDNKSSKHSKTKSDSREGSKHKSSRESSRDKSSRESSKDRSRDNSKDRSKHSRNRDSSSSKHHHHHHKDHRKSSDSRDSHKSRESSKSRDSKERKISQSNTQDSPQKSTTDTKAHSSESIEENTIDNRDKKIYKSDNQPKEVVKSKISKEHDSKRDLKKHKSSSENKDKKPVDTPVQKSKEKSSSQSVNTAPAETKQNTFKDGHKPSSSSTKNDSNMTITSSESKQDIIRDSQKIASSSSTKSGSKTTLDPSKERKSISKTKDTTKSSSGETKKPEHSTNLKESAVTDNEKVLKTNDKPREVSKSTQNTNENLEKRNTGTEDRKSVQNITKSSNDKSLINKAAPEKKAMQNPTSLSTNLNTSKTPSKNIECNKNVEQAKKDNTDTNKAVSEKKEINKTTTKSDETNKTKKPTAAKQQQQKESLAVGPSTKRDDLSSSKTSISDRQDSNAPKKSENVENIKTDELKSKEKSSELKKPKEQTLKNIEPIEQAKTSDIKNKDQKIPISPKSAPKPKDVIIKKTETAKTNLKEGLKAKQQADKVSAQKTEKINKVEEKTTATSENKAVHSKSRLEDTKISSEKTEHNTEKQEVVKSKSDAYKEHPKKTEINKSELKDENLDIAKSKATAIEKKDASNTVKSKAQQTPKKDKLGKEEKPYPEGKSKSIKSGNSNNTNTTNAKDSNTLNKIKGHKVGSGKEKVLPPNKSTPSKTIKKQPSAPISQPKIDLIETSEPKNSFTNTETVSKEVEAIKTEETEHVQNSCLQLKIETEANENDEKVNEPVKTVKDVETNEAEIKDVVVIEKEEVAETKHLEGHVNEETKPDEGNDVTQQSDKKLEENKAAEPTAKSSKITDKSIFRKFGNDAANESEKIRSIMESVLEKKLVILLEPLKSIPRISRSRNEDIKKDEELGKEKTSENTETRKAKQSTDLKVDKVEKNENDKTEELEKNDNENIYKTEKEKIESGEHNFESMKTNEPTNLKAETEVTEKSDKESTPSDSKKEMTDLNTQKIETDKDINKIHIPENEKASTEREIKEPLESKKSQRVVDATERNKTEISPVESCDDKKGTKSDIEEENNPLTKTRKEGNIERDTIKEQCKGISNEELREKICSSPRQKMGLHETVKKIDIKEATLDEKISTKRESEEINIEPIRTRTRRNFKDASGKRKSESSDIESCDEYKLLHKETGEHFDFVTRKTRRQGDLKTEAESSDEKSFAKKVNEPIKRKTRSDLKEETAKERTEVLGVDSGEDPFEPMRKRRRVNLKIDSGKETPPSKTSDKNERVQYETSGKKEHIATTKTEDPKQEIAKTETENEVSALIKDVKSAGHSSETEKEKSERPIKLDLETKAENATKESFQAETADEINCDQKETTDYIETIISKECADNKTDSEKDEMYKAESSEEKSDKKGTEENFELITTREAETSKTGLSKEKILVQENLNDQTEKRITRSRAEVTGEAKKDLTQDVLDQTSCSESNITRDNAQQNTAQENIEDQILVEENLNDQIEKRITRSRAEVTGEAEKDISQDILNQTACSDSNITRDNVQQNTEEENTEEKILIEENLNDQTEKRITRSRAEVTGAAKKDRSQDILDQTSCSDSNITIDNAQQNIEGKILVEENLNDRTEKRITRSRTELTGEAEKDISQDILNQTACSDSNITRDNVQQNTEEENTEEKILVEENLNDRTEKRITRSRAELTGEAKKDRSQDILDQTIYSDSNITRDNAQQNIEEKILVEENLNDRTEKRITRSRAEVTGEAKKDLSQDILHQTTCSDSKTIKDNTKPCTEKENAEAKNIKNYKDLEKDSLNDIVQTSHDDSQKQKVVKSTETLKQPDTTCLTARDESEILQCGKVSDSTADETVSKEVISKVSNTDPSSNNTTLKTPSEAQKISEENLGSENEMSGCESSSSDSIFRRTLRKRATDSPFAENDNKKRTFKEPPVLKSPAPGNLTQKKAKTGKRTTTVLTSASKRSLRPSHNAETEIQNTSKKPKLDISKKSTRSNDPHDGCLEAEELAIVSTKPSVISKERHYLEQGKPLELDKQNPNEKSTIVIKTLLNKNTKEVKDTPKNTAISAKGIEDGTTSKTSLNILQKEVEVKASKEPLFTLTKPNNNPVTIKKINTPKEAKVENEPKSYKEKLKATISKSSTSATVISFSDWLKNKNENNASEVNNESISAKESTPDTLMRQVRARVRLTPKLNENKDVPTMVCQNKEKVSEKSSALEEDYGKAAKEDKALESTNISVQLDSTSLLTSDTQLQNVKKSIKKVSVKRLQGTMSPTKSQVLNKTSPRLKKSETDLLIESISKELKDKGISDLLNTQTQVKRQRIPNKRNLRDNALSGTLTPTPTTAKESIVQLPNANTSGLISKNESPKVFHLGIQNVVPASKNISKSPTRRKPQQTAEKSPEIAKQDAKVLTTKTRRSLNVKDLVPQIEKQITDIATTVGVKSRKSMPVLTKETFAEVTNVTSRKSLGISKQQQLSRHEVASSDAQFFKTPKQGNASNISNKIPISSAEDIKRPESRIKLKQTENLLKKFKCRKLCVRLDRLVVESYLNSIIKRGNKKFPRNRAAFKRVCDVATTATDTSAIIQNNSETSIRIESVVDASTMLNTVAQPIIIPSTNTFLDTRIVSSPVPGIQGTYILQNNTDTVTSLTTSSIVNVTDVNETIELKNEFMDEINEAILPDTPTLLARAQTITEAAQQALSSSVTPTDIRLLTTDSSENSFVPSFGVTPRALDNRGTCMYTFLHPAKYNRNHSNVLLDYCCPNLDGPMPAIDPTRIHAQVQVPVIEVPASIVLTTKVVTRADLDSGSSSIPSIIRKKAEKIRRNMATHHKMAVGPTTATTQVPPVVSSMAQPILSSSPRPSLPPTINALTKQLPSTTTITPKVRPLLMQQSQLLPLQPASTVATSVAPSLPRTTVSVVPKGQSSQLNNIQQSNIRSNLRRFDVLLKQLVQPYETLTFVERHRIIEHVIASGKFLPKDLDQTIILLEEFIKQTLLMKNNDSFTPTVALPRNNVPTNLPQLQPSPKILASNATPTSANTYAAQYEQLIHKSGRKVPGKNASLTANQTGVDSPGATIKQRQVPIYDTDRNIIGYQMHLATPLSSMPAYTKSTMSTNSGAIMSTCLDSGNNKTSEYSLNTKPVKRLAQDSPRVFYTTPPIKTSTPKANVTPNVYPANQTKHTNAIPQKTQRSAVTSVRSGSSLSTSASGTITTTTTATVKRITRSTATGSKIIVVSKSNLSNEESILPDVSSNSQAETEQTEIKHEKDTDDFLG